MRYCYHTDPEHTHGVVFNVVGELKGILRESQSVPVDRLSDLEKVQSRLSAFSLIFFYFICSQENYDILN